MGSSRSIGKGVKGSVGSRQGVVPSILRPVESPQHLTQPYRAVHQSHLPSIEFGSEKLFSTSSADGKAPDVGKGAKAKSKSNGSVDAYRRGSNHGSRARAQMGDFSPRENADLVANDAGTVKSQSDYDLGLVQQGRDGGMEVHTSGDTSQYPRGLTPLDRSGVDGVGSPVVDFSIGQTNESRGQDFRVASSIAAISGAKLKQIKSGGRHHGKDSLDCRDRGSAVLGKRDFQGSGQNRSSVFQLAGQLKGAANGDSRTFVDNSGRGGITQETIEGDGMEVSAQVGEPVST